MNPVFDAIQRHFMPYGWYILSILAAELMYVPRQKKRGNPVIVMPLAIAAFLLIAFLQPDYFSGNYTMLVIFLESILCLIAMLDIPLKSTVFIAFSAYAIQNLAFSFMGILYLVFPTLDPVSAGWAHIVFNVGSNCIVYFICYHLIVKKFPEDGIIYIKNLTCYILAGVTLVIVFLRADVLMKDNSLMDRAFGLLNVVMVIMLQTLAVTFTRSKEENAIIARLLAQEESRQKMLSENIDAINMKSHDLRYHIDKYKSENHLEQHAEFFREVEDVVNIFDNIAKTGNAALDTIMSEKLLYCQSKGITLSYMADPDALGFLAASDIYSLFGNAIDNAIEGVLKEPEDLRVISISVRKLKGLSHIVFENYCSTPPAILDGLPKTSKDSASHGYGVRSIRYIVEKYGGSMQIGTDNSLFTLTILFPLEKAETK